MVFTVSLMTDEVIDAVTVMYTISVGEGGHGCRVHRLRRRRYDVGYADFRSGCNG